MLIRFPNLQQVNNKPASVAMQLFITPVPIGGGTVFTDVGFVVREWDKFKSYKWIVCNFENRWIADDITVDYICKVSVRATWVKGSVLVIVIIIIKNVLIIVTRNILGRDYVDWCRKRK